MFFFRSEHLDPDSNSYLYINILKVLAEKKSNMVKMIFRYIFNKFYKKVIKKIIWVTGILFFGMGQFFGSVFSSWGRIRIHVTVYITGQGSVSEALSHLLP